MGEHFPGRIAMVLRLFVPATVVFIGVSLASSPVFAEEPKAECSKATIEQAEKTVTPPPTIPRRTRFSTWDRWRGKPYLRGVSDESLRARALDIALPPANPAFQGGAHLHSRSR
jgi:hypothetical protein